MQSIAFYICLINIACRAQMETLMLQNTIHPWILDNMFPQLIQALLTITLAKTR